MPSHLEDTGIAKGRAAQAATSVASLVLVSLAVPVVSSVLKVLLVIRLQ